MSAYTPGPWHVSIAAECYEMPNSLAVFANAQHKQPSQTRDACITLVSPISKTTEVDWANARLIAAAPDLLEALEECRQFVAYAFDQGIEGAEEAGLKMDAAIAKAKGGQA